MSSKNDVEKNIELLKSNFKSISDITVSFDRYDLILYNYDEIEDITKFIEQNTNIKSWTALKTRVNPNTDLSII